MKYYLIYVVDKNPGSSAKWDDKAFWNMNVPSASNNQKPGEPSSASAAVNPILTNTNAAPSGTTGSASRFDHLFDVPAGDGDKYPKQDTASRFDFGRMGMDVTSAMRYAQPVNTAPSEQPMVQQQSDFVLRGPLVQAAQSGGGMPLTNDDRYVRGPSLLRQQPEPYRMQPEQFRAQQEMMIRGQMMDDRSGYGYGAGAGPGRFEPPRQVQVQGNKNWEEPQHLPGNYMPEYADPLAMQHNNQPSEGTDPDLPRILARYKAIQRAKNDANAMRAGPTAMPVPRQAPFDQQNRGYLMQNVNEVSVNNVPVAVPPQQQPQSMPMQRQQMQAMFTQQQQQPRQAWDGMGHNRHEPVRVPIVYPNHDPYNPNATQARMMRPFPQGRM